MLDPGIGIMVKRNPSKAERRKALLRASQTLRNYILAAKSGVQAGYYTQNEFGKIYSCVETLEKIASKMK